MGADNPWDDYKTSAPASAPGDGLTSDTAATMDPFGIGPALGDPEMSTRPKPVPSLMERSLPQGAPVEVSMAFSRLNDKQKAFALALPLAASQKEAARLAGYSEATAKGLAFKVAKHPDVQTVVAYLAGIGANGGVPAFAGSAADALLPARDTVERTVEELGRIAFADPRTLFDNSGNLLPIHEWPDDIARTVSSIESFEEYQGRGETREAVGMVRKVKFHPKIEGINTLSKIKGWFKPERHEHDVTDPLKALLQQVSGTSLPIVADPPKK